MSDGDGFDNDSSEAEVPLEYFKVVHPAGVRVRPQPSHTADADAEVSRARLAGVRKWRHR